MTSPPAEVSRTVRSFSLPARSGWTRSAAGRSDARSARAVRRRPFDALPPAWVEQLAPGGRAILSGILIAQADEVAAAYAASGMAVERRDDIGEWSTLVVRRG